STGMAEWLKEQQIDTVYVLGLATDYCVKFTVLDALQEGFATHLVTDASRGVNLNAGDVDRAIEEMAEKGASLTTTGTILSEFAA
ncbi:MAG: isochorismatase family protein, partial [Bacteroidota bacterium]